jgi:hypothetical protein
MNDYTIFSDKREEGKSEKVKNLQFPKRESRCENSRFIV